MSKKKGAVPKRKSLKEETAQVEEPVEAEEPVDEEPSGEVEIVPEKQEEPLEPAYMQTYVFKLRNALKLLKPIVPKKTSLEVIKNVLVADGKMMANNLEMYVAINYPEAQGKFLIPHEQVLDLLGHVPGNEVLNLEQSRHHLKLLWESGKAQYDTLDPNDFPIEPEVEEKGTADFDGDRLIGAMMSVVDYCATEDQRPVLQCVDVVLGENIEVAAADGFRLAHQVIPVSSPVQAEFLIPSHLLSRLADLWDKSPPSVPPQTNLINQVMAKRQLSLMWGEHRLVARFGQITAIMQLTQGVFPNYKQLIPEEPPIHVRFFAHDLERAVLAVKMVSKDSGDRVYLEWTAHSVNVSASAEKGEAEINVKVQADSPGKIAINYKYLLEYLAEKDGLVAMGVDSAQSPVLLRHSNSPTIVLMPMFMGSEK